MLNYAMLTPLLVALVLLLSGCVSDAGTSEDSPSSSTSASNILMTSSSLRPPTSTLLPQHPTSSSLPGYTAGEYCVRPPGDDCECIQWRCPTTTSTSTTGTSTSSTCVKVEDTYYITTTRRFSMLISGQKFIPEQINVYEGDLVIVNVTNLQGLHRIRDTSSGKSYVLTPGSSQDVVFYATQEGLFELTCNPYCENPMNALIVVEKPYKTIC